MNPKRALLFAALALAVPLPALALEGGSGGASLGVQASFNGCGVAGGSIMCRINAGFSPLSDADYYTASVTAADGSVTDFGVVAESGGGSAELTVPYSGNGGYTVTVTAWGYDEQGKPGVVGSDEADAGGKAKQEGGLEAVEQPPQGGETGETPAPGEPEQPPECPEAETLDPDGVSGDAATEPAAAPPPDVAPGDEDRGPCKKPGEKGAAPPAP